MNNLIIIFEDKHILVCHKKAGIPVQTNSVSTKDMVSIIKSYLFTHTDKKGEPYLGIIHRLDQPVEGLIVFAKTPAAAKALSFQVTNNTLQKYYFAIVEGTFDTASGELNNYLIKDSRTQMAKIADKTTPGAKLAKLEYKVLGIKNNTSLLDIKLHTGRFHQIRAQLSNASHSIMGDLKYGHSNDGVDCKYPALCSYRLAFNHPITNNPMDFRVLPEGKCFYQSWTESDYNAGKL